MNLAELKIQCDFKLIYLKNNYVVHRHEGKEYKIFGTPYCHIFGSWPFMRNDEYMEEKFKKIPEVVDIILSHDPPYGIGQVDQILETTRWSNNLLKHCGNLPLAKRLGEIEYQLLVCGHIHSGDHELFEFNGGQVVNVSIKNENYQVQYEPFYTTIEK